MAQWLRRKSDGVIYGYHESLAKQADLEPVTEEEAWPERFMPPVDPVAQAERAAKSKLAKNLMDAVEEKAPVDDTKLRREASRKLPK